jgi:hypothetical protein
MFFYTKIKRINNKSISGRDRELRSVVELAAVAKVKLSASCRAAVVGLREVNY